MTESHESFPAVHDALLQKLLEFGEIDEIRSDLLRCSLLDGSLLENVVDECLRRLAPTLPYRLVSVYLLNRVGDLERIGAAPTGQPLPSFKPLPSQDWSRLLPGWNIGTRKRDLYVRQGLAHDDPAETWLRAAVGPVTDVIRVPLNGSSQTFGILEAVNPKLRQTEWDPEVESRRNIRRLVFIGSALASAITVWRARNEVLAVGHVMTALAGADLHAGTDETEIETVFETALEIGLHHLRDYRAAILRIENPLDATAILAKSKNSDLSWDGWVDRELRSGRYLAELVINSMKPVKIKVIADNAGLFANFDWIRRAGLRSAACVPMQLADTTLGTLTVFTGFEYDFSDLDVRMLGAMADGFAMFWQRLQIHRRLVAAEQTSAQHQMRKFFSLLHTTKNRWSEVEALLNLRTQSGSQAALRIASDELAALTGSTILDARGDSAVDVAATIQKVVRTRQPSFRRARIKAVLELGETPLIKVPQEEFSEVLNNLLSNAIRAVEQAKRDKGEVKVSACVEHTRGRDDLVMSVRDNGVGIPRDRLEKVFEREFTTEQRFGGTGLGLFIARDIVESYGGGIRAESRLGEGSIFTVRLPLSWIAA